MEKKVESDEVRQKRLEYHRQWRKNNPEKVKKYHRDFYERMVKAQQSK